MQSSQDHKLKIYFCGSIRGVEADRAKYQQITKILSEYGDVLTIHVAYLEKESKDLTDQQIYNRDFNWFTQSKMMVAEVTAPSHGVGMELGWGIIKENYPILCLGEKSPQYRTSALVKGCPKIAFKQYEDIKQIENYIREFMEKNGVKKL